jgi:hypothetical protein
VVSNHDTEPLDPTAAIERVGDLAAAAADLAFLPGTAVVPSGVGQAAAVKADMVDKRAALLRQKQAVETAAAEAKALVQAQVKAMEAKLAEQLALLEPAMKQLARLSDGVDALNIYLGRDEEIITLRDGERAPAGTVITVRQLVLAMDEESVIAVDKDGMDFRDIDAFGEWLLRDPAHLEQLLPEVKGIVALIPRRAKKEYSDPWMQRDADLANARTWWLIRNGEALFLTTTAFTVGNHTVPAPKEFTDMFMARGRFGEPARKLEPGSAEWVKAEERADLRTRHYMKVALLLQGLLDRTAVLHPHDGASFLDEAHYNAGRVKVILDGENAIGDGRPSYRDWRRERVAQMHAGMRVIGAFGSRMRQYDSKDYGSADVRPQGSTPASLVPYNVRASGRGYTDWEFSFERGDIWDDEIMGYRPAKTKATGYLSNTAEWWLPLDTITEDEIQYYLGARSQRHAYLDMVPTLQAALAVKQAEREAEAPFRAALRDALSREAGLDSSDELAGALISWYKTGNKHHRALDADDAKAAKAILTEARRRARGEDKDGERARALRDIHPNALIIARRSADFVVVEPEERALPGTDTNVFARLNFYTPAGKLTETRRWTALTRAQVARWTILHESDSWSSWALNPELNEHFTDAELLDVIDDVRRRFPSTFIIRVENNQFTRGALGKFYTWDSVNGVQDARFNLYREKGAAKLYLPYRPTKSSRGHDLPTWEERWHGAAKPDHNIWVDTNTEAQARSEWRAAEDRILAEREAKNRVIRVANRVEAAWEEQAEAELKARFVEDFGDVSLWEGHSKSIKLPKYPHRWEGDKAFREGLATAFAADPELDVAGMTVAEILDIAGVDHDQVDASILDLRV